LPIIALNIGALPDFVDHSKNGFLVEYNDIQTLSDKLILLLEKPELCQKMGDIGYEKMKNRYQWITSFESIKQVISNDLDLS
jgi:glycosyltransferase involved in cell wall biosynthesis